MTSFQTFKAGDRQQKFLDALAHFENLAIDGKSRPFLALDAAAQDAILEATSKMEAGVPEDDRNWGWFQVPGTKAPGPPKLKNSEPIRLDGFVAGDFATAMSSVPARGLS